MYDNNDFIILGVGQIQKRKGIFDFIKLAESHPEWKFIWAGGFSFGSITAGYNELKKIVENPPSNLIFTGIIDRNIINEYYNLANIFLLPSYTELFPMSILEAFSSGVPVMVRDLKLYKEIIATYCMTFNDLNEIDIKLTKLKNDEKYKKDMLNKSFIASNIYSEEHVSNVWLDYYKTLVKE